MPTYEYECRSCGERCEFFQPMGSEPKKTCPSCKKRKLERLIGAGAGILFKGSGFYETDYRSENYKKRSTEDSSSQKESASKSESKSDSSGAKKGSSSKSDGTKSSGAKSD